MSSALEKLNLRPGEKRLVIVIGLALFVVLNYLFVWPRFGDLGKLQDQLEKDRTSIQRFQTEIGRSEQYKKRNSLLERSGTMVGTAEQALQLQVAVQRQAAASGVAILTSGSSPGGAGKLSDFFDEQSLRVTANSGDKELVDFLYRLGSGDSLIRVRDLSLSPDTTGIKLSSQITLVASYQKAVSPAKTAATKKKP